MVLGEANPKQIRKLEIDYLVVGFLNRSFVGTVAYHSYLIHLVLLSTIPQIVGFSHRFIRYKRYVWMTGPTTRPL
jgi:hypothetical protein